MRADEVTPSRLRFGAFEFEPASGELYRDGKAVRVQEQPRQVLATLVARAGEIVTRDELRERLWSGDTFVDFEHGLNTAIKKVRQALGDSAEHPQFIETIARRGYRFVAPVASVEPAVRPPAPKPPTGEAVRVWARLRYPRVLLAAGLVLLIAAGAWLARTRNGPAERAAGTPARVAVLPLRVLAEQQSGSSYLGVGIADAITTRLANVRQIAASPTTAVLPYREGVLRPEDVARELGVDHVLVGTLQAAEQAYRVAVQLVRADGVAVWGRTYDVPRADLLRLQDEVAEQVVRALRVELSASERARFSVRHTDDPAAYDLYLRGRTLLVDYTEAKMREAIDFFERAVAADPGYGLARAALATACAWFSVRYAYQADARVWGQRAEDHARRALEQDASLAEAHLALASAAGTLYGGFNWPMVMSESATALALDPSLDLAHVARMRALYHVGRFDEAFAAASLARTLNPRPGVELARLEVAVQLFAGRFDEAARHADDLLQRTDVPSVRHHLGLAQFYQGNVDAARQTLASVTRAGQPDVRAQASLASIEAAAGMRDQALARVRAIERRDDVDHHVAYSLGAAWAQLGDSAASVRWLRQAADTGFACSPWFARDTLLDPVRADPAFRELMSGMLTRGAPDSRR